MKEKQVIIQGITNSLASYYAKKMKEFGTNIVAGIAAGEDIQEIGDIPVFDLVENAISQLGKIDISLIFVPSYQVLDAGLEAMASEIKQIIIVTPKIPPLDMVRLKQKAQATNTIIIGPGSSGIIIPEKICLGIFDQEFYCRGNVGILSTTDYLSYEISLALKKSQLGESIVVSLGKDDISGSSWQYWLEYLQNDEDTEIIIMSAPLNTIYEENIAEYISNSISKPVIAYFIGLQAPLERNFKDAATIIANQLSYSVPTDNRHDQLLESFKRAKIPLAKSPTEISDLILKVRENP
jgi:succinyl-CoA synthetase alpha subunit